MVRELDWNEITIPLEEIDEDGIGKEERIVGQERGMRALRLGLSIDKPGYNIYVSGEGSSARHFGVMMAIREFEDDTRNLKDAVYVKNGFNPTNPISITLEKGEGRKFARMLKALGEGKLGRDDFLEAFPYEEVAFFLSYIPKEDPDGSFFEANVVLDRSQSKKRPVLLETHPSHDSLFGFVESGMSEHMGIRLGSYQLASGGYLIMSAEELMQEKSLWPTLKRYIETSQNLKDTIWYLRKNGKGLLDLSKSAISELLRYSSWFAEDRNMLTSQLSFLGDLETEADRIARKKGKEEIEGDDVRDAIEERSYISSLTEEQITREIMRGDLLVSLSGKKVGIVNGLAVIDRGLSSFGTPAVISATTAPGNEGIVNIEHEAGLSGGIHDKGLLILEGYLRHRYARTFPLSLYAGICFEQSYAEVDGDSASSAELFALLSAIGNIPLREDIAVTGSVNQMGYIQPVGGINEKIEGFYKACLATGLTGEQGVMIPSKNIESLILPYQVENAVKNGKFHIWAIDTVDDGMELLSNLIPGERNSKGQFPTGSVNKLVEDGLKKLYSHANKS